MLEEELTNSIIGGAIEVHKHWGPSLDEEIYERSLCRELTLRGHKFEQQLHPPLVYKNERVGDDLKLTGCRIGLRINFNVPVLKAGIKRIVL
ncbi:MAG: hypothetical protein ACI8Z5_000415 [Lentimonas sp.]|jgi:hypothetical protein